MKRLFPYLTPKNFKHLFSSKSAETGKFIGEHANGEGSVAQGNGSKPFTVHLEDFPDKSYAALVELVKQATRLPFWLVCETNGKVIWEFSDRAFELKPIEKDILTHLRQGLGTDVGEIKKLTPYPQGVRGEPNDGVIRFGLVAPLVSQGQRIGALCGFNDAEMLRTPKLTEPMQRAAGLMVDALEASAREVQANLESEAREKVQSFLNRSHGQAFAVMACKKLAEWTEMELAFVLDRHAISKPESKVSVAVFEGVSIEPFFYDYQASAFDQVKPTVTHIIPAKAAELCASAPKVIAEQIESIAGVVLAGERGTAGGAIILMGRQPIKNEEVIRVYLETMAPRMAAELAAAERISEGESRRKLWQQRYDNLFSASNAGVMTVGQDGALIAANEALSEMLLFSEKSLLGRKVEDLIVGGFSEKERRLREECSQGKRNAYQIRRRLKREDEEELSAQISVHLIPGDNPDENWWIESVTDISQQESFARQLRKIEQELEQITVEKNALFLPVPYPLARIDSAGAIIELNAAFARLFDTDLTRLRSTTLKALVMDQDTGLAKVLEQAREKQESLSAGIFNWKKESGETFQGQLYCTGVRSVGEESMPLLISIKDVSEAEALNQANDFAKSTLDALALLPGFALGWVNESGMITSASLELEQMLGRSENELEGLSFFDLFELQEGQDIRGKINELVSGQRRTVRWKSDNLVSLDRDHLIEFSVVSIPSDVNPLIVFGCQDLTEEKQLTVENIQLSNRLDEVFEVAESGLILLDSEFNIVRANFKCSRWLDMDSEKLTGTHMLGWVAESDRVLLQRRMEDAANGGRLHLELELVNGSGTHIPVYLVGSAIQQQGFDGSASVEWLIYLTNLTAKREAEQQLVSIRNELSAVTLRAEALKDMQSVGILLVGMDEEVLEANTYFQNQLGEGHTAVGSELADCFVFSDEEQDAFHEGMVACLSGKRDAYEFTARLNRQDETVWGQAMVHTVFGDDNVVQYLVVSWRDITPLRELQQQWELLDAPYQQLIESMEWGVVALNRDGTVIRANQATAGLTGLSCEEIIGEKISTLFSGDIEKIKSSWISEPEFSTEASLIGRDGKPQAVRIISKSWKQEDHDTLAEFLSLILIQPLGPEAKLKNSLKESQDRFHALFDRSDIAMAVCDANGQLLESNAALQLMTGLENDVLRHKSWSDFLEKGKWQPLDHQSDPHPIQADFRFSDENHNFGQLFIQPYRGEHNATGKYVCLFQNLSQQKVWERRSGLLQSRMDAILNNPAIGIAILNSSGEVVETNEIFRDFFAGEKDTVEGYLLSEFLPEKQQEELLALWRSLQEGERSRFQLSFSGDRISEQDRVETDSTKSGRMTAVLLDATAQNEFAIVLLEDLSELEQTKFELAEMKTLQEQTADKLTDLKSRYESTSGELKSSIAAYTALEAAKAALGKELSQNQSDLEELNSRHEQLQSERKELVQLLEQVQGDLQQMQASYDHTTEALLSSQKNCSELEKTRASLNSKLEEAHVALEQSGQKNKELESARDSLLNKEQKLVSQIADAQAKIQVLESELSATKEKLSGAEQEIDLLTADRNGLLSRILEPSLVATAVMTRSGLIEHANQAFFDMVQSTSEQVLQSHFSEVFATDLEGENQQALERVCDGEQRAFEMELGLQLQDQSLRWLHIKGSAFQPPGAEENRCLLVLEETTAIYEAQAETEASEQRFIATAESNLVGLALSDIEGKLFFTNPVLNDWLGTDATELSGKSINDFAHDEDPQEDIQLDERSANGELDDYRVDKMLDLGDGKVLWLRMGVHNVRMEDGTFWYAVRIFEDLTELHQLKDQLAQTEKRWEDFFAAAGVPLMLMGGRGDVLKISRGVTNLLGNRSPKQLGKQLAGLKSVGEGDSLSLKYQGLVSGEVEELELEDEIADSAGKTIPVKLTIRRLNKADGSFDTALAVIEKLSSKFSGEPESVDQVQEDHPDESEPKTDTVKPGRTKDEDTDEKKETAKNTQALKASVQISKSQKLDVDAIQKIKSSGMKKVTLAKPGSSPQLPPNGWVLADSWGNVVLLNQQARDLLGVDFQDSLKKSLSDVMRIKDQRSWNRPNTEVDKALQDITLNESDIQSGENETQTVVHMNRRINDKNGEEVGVLMVLQESSLFRKPDVDDEEISPATYRHTAYVLNQTFYKIQEWSKKGMAELLVDMDLMGIDDYIVEAKKAETEISV